MTCSERVGASIWRATLTNSSCSACIAVLLCVVTAGSAQAQTPTGAIGGAVSDPSGTALAGVSVQIGANLQVSEDVVQEFQDEQLRFQLR